MPRPERPDDDGPLPVIPTWTRYCAACGTILDGAASDDCATCRRVAHFRATQAHATATTQATPQGDPIR